MFGILERKRVVDIELFFPSLLLQLSILNLSILNPCGMFNVATATKKLGEKGVVDNQLTANCLAVKLVVLNFFKIANC